MTNRNRQPQTRGGAPSRKQTAGAGRGEHSGLEPAPMPLSVVGCPRRGYRLETAVCKHLQRDRGPCEGCRYLAEVRMGLCNPLLAFWARRIERQMNGGK